MSERAQRKERIAILGGGLSSLMAAYRLTEEAGWRERYEVTVYQMGWRLGGKAASARNREAGGRIEEHGLHVFYGFYENAFRVIRGCYEELGRKAGEPLATWREAFTPHSLIVLEEWLGEGWDAWRLPFPPNDREPGDGTPLPTMAESMAHLIHFAAGVFDDWHFGRSPKGVKASSFVEDILGLLPDLLRLAGEGGARWGDRAWSVLQCALLRMMQGATRLAALEEGERGGVERLLLGVASVVAGRLGVEGGSPALVRLLGWLLRSHRDALHRLDRSPRGERSQHTRRMLICEDLFLTVIVGMIEEGGFGEEIDWRKLDEMDIKDWLRKHGAHPTTVDSTLIASLYDAAFSRDHGAAAGTLLHCMLRMFGTYKGAFMWKMCAGMGETIIAPLYLVLRQRGVSFRFFQRVDRLEVGEEEGGQKRIARVVVGQQARLRDEAYHPLIDVDGLPCWPEKPLYEQLVEGEALRAGQHNLENWWTTWKDPIPPVILEAGKDFDRVILGISMGALPYLCEELAAASPRFGAMLKRVPTVATHAAQLWFRPTLAQKGWGMEPPILIQFADPFDTWADMTHLLAVEGSPKGHPVGSIAYLCARMPDSEPPPARCDHAYPSRQMARVEAHLRGWLRDHAAALWPHLQGEALWEALIDPQGRRGEDRLAAQYWHTPLNPSDRYVVAPAGSTRYRLFNDESGFCNLVLAGDWTLNAMNIGCVEAATLSGLHAAQVILGKEEPLAGDWLAAFRGRKDQ